MKRLCIIYVLVVLFTCIGITKNEIKNTHSGEKIMSLMDALNAAAAGPTSSSPLNTTNNPYAVSGGALAVQPVSQEAIDLSYRDNSGGGGGYSAPAPDPYAKWGGQAAYNNMVNTYDQQKGVITNSAADAADTAASNTRNSILDFIDMYKGGQSKIDQAAANNMLAKRQGVSGIMGMVGRGIRSGGVTLANKNASDSSAAGAIARAYGDIGSREMRNVGNQYELQNQEIGLQQADLGRQVAKYTRDYETNKMNAVNAITNEAYQKLAALDADIANADLPNRIALEQEKGNIKAMALQKLSALDQTLTSQRDAIKPLTAAQRQQKALEMQNAGKDLGEGAFNFSESTPMEFQGTGPFASDLPLFSAPRSKRR